MIGAPTEMFGRTKKKTSLVRVPSTKRGSIDCSTTNIKPQTLHDLVHSAATTHGINLPKVAANVVVDSFDGEVCLRRGGSEDDDEDDDDVQYIDSDVTVRKSLNRWRDHSQSQYRKISQFRKIRIAVVFSDKASCQVSEGKFLGMYRSF